MCTLGRLDTKHNDNQHNDTQHNDSQYHYTQLNGFWDIQYKYTKYNYNQHKNTHLTKLCHHAVCQCAEYRVSYILMQNFIMLCRGTQVINSANPNPFIKYFFKSLTKSWRSTDLRPPLQND
jgi:hypothetical protein